ncbi:MAG: PHP-associated domain-containing protein [Patescibacteria group bacterium]
MKKLDLPKIDIHKIEEIASLGKADLHIHSNHSDARPSIQEILDYVENHTNLDVIAITDHDKISGALEAQELLRQKKYRFEVIIGEEVTSKEGHILGLFLKEPIPGGLNAHHTLERIHAQGGIAIAAHPFQHVRVRDPRYLTLDGVGLVTIVKEKNGFDAVEVVNATPTLGEENLRAAFVNRTMLFKGETGSSDAHIVEAIGKGYTLFEGNTVQDLHKALKHHQTQAMYAPWTLMALFKYLFFFIPKGLRLAFFTLVKGRREKRPQLINLPKIKLRPDLFLKSSGLFTLRKPEEKEDGKEGKITIN